MSVLRLDLLESHGEKRAYIRCKRQIYEFQKPEVFLVSELLSKKLDGEGTWKRPQDTDAPDNFQLNLNIVTDCLPTSY